MVTNGYFVGNPFGQNSKGGRKMVANTLPTNIVSTERDVEQEATLLMRLLRTQLINVAENNAGKASNYMYIFCLLADRRKTSDVAEQWMSNFESTSGRVADEAKNLVETIRTKVNEFVSTLDENMASRKRPEILGSLTQYAKTNGKC